MKVLLTGGLGYIGSHTAVELLEANHNVVIVDNLSNSKKEVVNKIEQITRKVVKFYQEDLLNISGMSDIIEKEKPDQIIHFAGFKAVGESVKVPLLYYENNIQGTINLLKCMEKYNIKNMIFSSSATVYGKPRKVPITEKMKLQTTNPYGRTKLFIEEILRDYAIAHSDFNCVILRYFNPVGAHESGLIGDNPNGVPNNLMPYISRVASGKLNQLNVFGNDYNTHDGTGVRDYIHVVDLARAHVLALEKNEQKRGVTTYNIGTGVGYSVLDMIHAYEKANKLKINFKIVERRPGDIDECYACPKKAEEELHFVAKYNLEDMCRTVYNFEKLQNKK